MNKKLLYYKMMYKYVTYNAIYLAVIFMHKKLYRVKNVILSDLTNIVQWSGFDLFRSAFPLFYLVCPTLLYSQWMKYVVVQYIELECVLVTSNSNKLKNTFNPNSIWSIYLLGITVISKRTFKYVYTIEA